MAYRVLLAEDEAIVAFDLCDTFEEAGYEVAGPFSGLSSAMLASQDERPDVAILDIALNDGDVYPLAKKLEESNVPIIFHSGMRTHDEVKAQFPRATTLSKPCPPADMLGAINGAIAACANSD